jgi:hypothetical protein
MAEDGVLETHPQGATRFPGGDRTLAASSSTAESGAFEAHGRSRALVSSEARHPDRFTLHPAVGGDRRTGWYAQTSMAVISPPHCVRWEGVEPSRPKTHASEACAAASYATSARTGRLRPFESHVSVSMRQLAHRIRRLRSSFLRLSPSTWSTCSGAGWPRHSVRPHS